MSRALDLRRETLVECRRAVGTRVRKSLAVITLVLGLLPGVAIAATTPSSELTFGLLTPPVQSLMSVTLPFLGVLLVTDLHRDTAGVVRIPPKLLAATALAVACAIFGIGVCTVAVMVSSSAGPRRWQHLGLLVVGGLAVLVTAQLVGTGLGLVFRSPVVAIVGTVLPLGVFGILGAAAPLRPAQAWLTPFASARNLLSGTMTPESWAQALVVFVLWAVGLNVWGVTRLRRRRGIGSGRRSNA